MAKGIGVPKGTLPKGPSRLKKKRKGSHVPCKRGCGYQDREPYLVRRTAGEKRKWKRGGSGERG